jgi:predicted membrane metal-binding protein
MPTNFHESYAGSEIKPPSERSTGLVFAAVAVIFAVLWRNSPTVPWVALGMAAILAAVSLIAPVLLKPINILWFKFGLLLHRVVNPIVMFAVFATVFVPAGVIMRLWRDPLRLRRGTTGASTYWIEHRESGDTEGSMTNQF